MAFDRNDDLGPYVQAASVVYHHYREKSLEERIERRGVRRAAIYDNSGLNISGEARRQFVLKIVEEKVAEGFLGIPREFETRDTSANDFFRTHVEAEYNATRRRQGLQEC
jgi:hypothetical protein